MATDGKCPLCSGRAKVWDYDATCNRRAYECDICGRFYLLDMLDHDIDSYQGRENFYKAAGWVCEQNRLFGNNPEIDREKLETVLAMPDKKIRQKFDLMMQWLFLNQKNISFDKLKVCSWIKDNDELEALLNKALRENFIEGKVEKALSGELLPIINGLTFDGLEYVESLEEPNIASKQVFAAFHFDEEMKQMFDKDVREAVENCGLEYSRVSSSTTDLDKNINDEIIGLIKTSRLVIADFTNQRNSVYFEAGFAMGMGLPVIWTCKKDQVEQLAFDIRQYPVILWETGEDLKKALENRIRAVL